MIDYIDNKDRVKKVWAELQKMFPNNGTTKAFNKNVDDDWNTYMLRIHLNTVQHYQC